jgi:CheY-specific phosphatase CheX
MNYVDMEYDTFHIDIQKPISVSFDEKDPMHKVDACLNMVFVRPRGSTFFVTISIKILTMSAPQG